MSFKATNTAAVISPRWTVCKWSKCRYTNIWQVFEPDGTWSGTFESWAEAMDWATSISARVEHWLEHQR